MYPVLLTLHSLTRWLVLVGLLYAIYRGFVGQRAGKLFSRHDDLTRQWAVRIAEIQFMLGLGLYFTSPIVDYFLKNFKQALHIREIRFFGMEHICVMFIGIAVISVGSGKVKKAKTDAEKFRAMRVWFLVGLILILTSVPWAFSPLVSRPWIRWF